MKCNNCGKKAMIKDTDPYLDELYTGDDNPEVWWCEDCYQDRLDDI